VRKGGWGGGGGGGGFCGGGVGVGVGGGGEDEGLARRSCRFGDCAGGIISAPGDNQPFLRHASNIAHTLSLSLTLPPFPSSVSFPSVAQTRFSLKYRHSDASFVLKVTDDAVVTFPAPAIPQPNTAPLSVANLPPTRLIPVVLGNTVARRLFRCHGPRYNAVVSSDGHRGATCFH